MSKNIIDSYNSTSTLFKLSFKLYRKYFIQLILIATVFLIPPLLFNFLGWGETERIIFQISFNVFESIIALSILCITFHNVFSVKILIRSMGIKILIVSLFMASWKYVFFQIGISGLALPFPLNIIVITIWIIGLFLISMVMPIIVLEGWTKRDTNSFYDRFMTPSTDNNLIFIFKTIIFPIYSILVFGRSIKISLSNKIQVFLAMGLMTFLQFLFFVLFFQIFSLFFNVGSDHDIPNNGIQLSNLLNNPIFNDIIRWSQYLNTLFISSFSSILTVLLYFSSLHKQSSFDIETFSKFSNEIMNIKINSTF